MTDVEDWFSLPHSSVHSEYLAYTGPSFPTLLDDATFPRARYRSRGQEVKTALHWGQRKLLISEMQLLTYFAQPGVSYWIVYVGAAPGSHLMFLDDLYAGQHRWELIDPGAWDHRYATLPLHKRRRFKLRNEFFDNAQAYALAAERLVEAKCPGLSSVYSCLIEDALAATDAAAAAALTATALHSTSGTDAEAARTTDIPIKYVAPAAPAQQALHLLTRVAADRCPMLFVSDIRSGSEKACKVGEFDLHVHENMRAQEAWAEIINPTFAMLKFRLPYAFTSRFDFELKRQVKTPSLLPPTSLHFDGAMLLPVWTRPTSTECRLVVPAFSRKRVYDHQRYEDQLFFFNAVVRERVHFPHPFHGHEWVDHHYDGAAEVELLQRFVAQRGLPQPAPLHQVRELIDAISAAIGSSFERAYTNRENIHQGKAERAGWKAETENRLNAARQKRAEAVWHRELTASDGAFTASPRDNEGGDAVLPWNLIAFEPAEGTAAPPPAAKKHDYHR